MKSIRTLILGVLSILLATGLSAQDFDGYKYVYVKPLIYENNAVDIYGLCEQVKNMLSQKGLKMISESERDDPASKEMVYAVLDCIITHTNNFDNDNKVNVKFTNMTGLEVWSSEKVAGGSNLKTSLSRAMSQILKDLNRIKYKYDPLMTPKPFAKKTVRMDWKNPKPEWDEDAVRTYLDTCKNLDPIEGIYKSTQNERTKYFRIGIVRDRFNYKAVILETNSPLWEEGEIKCTFEPASAGQYSVTWYMNNKRRMDVFGELKNNGLLEIRISNDTRTYQYFLKIYPTMGAASPSSLQPSPSSPPQTSVSNKMWTPTVYGTGFFISKDGFVATNYHVVKGAKAINVDVLDEKTGSYVRYTADVVTNDPDNDIAIIRINDSDFKPFEHIPYTIETNANIGADVFTIGFPLSASIMGRNFKVTNGIVSAKTGLNDNIKVYQITVPIQSGNSGGPLFNKDGNIIGITSSGINRRLVDVENVNYAVKSLYLLSAINSLHTFSALPDTPTLKGKSLEEQIQVLKFYVCRILVK